MEKGTKPSTIHSDNPKMNTAEMPEMEGDGMMVVMSMPGYAMGGMIGGDPTMPVRNELTAAAKISEAMRKEKSDG